MQKLSLQNKFYSKSTHLLLRGAQAIFRLLAIPSGCTEQSSGS